MRVLHIIPGSVDDKSCMVFARRQAKAIQEIGVESEVFFLKSRTNPLTVLREVIRLRSVIRAFVPNIIHVHFGTATALLVALVTCKPLVISYRGSDLNPDPSVSRIRSLLQKVFSQLASVRASQVICVSKQLRRRLWLRKEIANVIPSGVDMDLFMPIPREKAREILNWEKEEKVVFFNARDVPKLKRLDLAKSAIEAAEKICGPVRLHVLNGKLDPDRVPVHISASNCVLLTSAYEGSPNVVKEALACNVPVVSVDVGDVRERLEGVANCRIVDSTPQDLGSAIAEIIIGNCCSNGREKVKELRDDLLAERIRQVYESCLFQ